MSRQLSAVDVAGTGLFDGGMSWGVVILGLLGFLAVVAVCGFGILARFRDRAADRRSLEVLRAERQKALGESAGGSEPSSL